MGKCLVKKMRDNCNAGIKPYSMCCGDCDLKEKCVLKCSRIDKYQSCPDRRK